MKLRHCWINHLPPNMFLHLCYTTLFLLKIQGLGQRDRIAGGAPIFHRAENFWNIILSLEHCQEWSLFTEPVVFPEQYWVYFWKSKYKAQEIAQRIERALYNLVSHFWSMGQHDPLNIRCGPENKTNRIQ